MRKARSTRTNRRRHVNSRSTRADLEEAQRLLLLHKLEALDLSPRQVAAGQGAFNKCAFRLEAERALEEAISLYAALKDQRVREPP